LEMIFGVPLADGIYSFKNTTSLTEKQKAVFGQADFRVVGGLIATLGLRYSKFDTDWVNSEGGPIAGGDWPGPSGHPEHGSASASVVIPKYMLSYKTDNTLTYASATKGFRNGGVNAPINNPACGPDLAALGLTAVPGSYDPDKLWSYELGTKLQMLDRRLIVDAAVFEYDWSDMISNQALTRCTLSYTTNIGSARGRGFELALQYLPIPELTLGMNVGYHKLESTQTIRATPSDTNPLGAIQVKDGQLLGDGGRLNANLQYTFNVSDLDAYFRADYNYNRSPTLLNEEGTASFITDSRRLFETPGYGTGNVRLGVNVGNWDLSIFSNNVTNKQVFFKSRATVGFNSYPTSVVTATTLLPRTYGLTAVYRY
ncbi:MAG TPA: TonB-dependent receptor, partial [Povalibacter sp.]|nr:TonB-dependent receptor [Povalibacter sp.]